MDESLSANFAEPALLQGRAAGVGQPFTNIVDCRLPISDLIEGNRAQTIGNWQLAIGNQHEL
jgi:hypothetical protein